MRIAHAEHIPHMCGLLLVVIEFVYFELFCVMLCAPALSLASFFSLFSETRCCVLLAVLRD